MDDNLAQGGRSMPRRTRSQRRRSRRLKRLSRRRYRTQKVERRITPPRPNTMSLITDFIQRFKTDDAFANSVIDAVNAQIAAGGVSPAALGVAPQNQQQRDPNDPTTWGRVSRNEACPCGSGKKFKHCHGVLA